MEPKETKEKLFFTWNGWLFCNTLFRFEGEPDDMPFDQANHDYTRSMYRIGIIGAANAATLKGCCTIRPDNIGTSITIQVPYSVIAAMIRSPEEEGRDWDDEEMYKKVIRKGK